MILRRLWLNSKVSGQTTPAKTRVSGTSTWRSDPHRGVRQEDPRGPFRPWLVGFSAGKEEGRDPSNASAGPAWAGLGVRPDSA